MCIKGSFLKEGNLVTFDTSSFYNRIMFNQSKFFGALHFRTPSFCILSFASVRLNLPEILVIQPYQ